MAKTEAKAAEAAPKKSNAKLLIILLSAILVAVLAGGAFLLLKQSDHGDDDEDVVQQEKPKKKKKEAHAPVFQALETFTVNLVPEQGDQYLQVGISVELEDVADGEKMKVFMPKLRNQITLMLSSKKASELTSKEGKEQLAEELRYTINEILDPPAKGKKAETPVKEVLFTSFIIQ